MLQPECIVCASWDENLPTWDGSLQRDESGHHPDCYRGNDMREALAREHARTAHVEGLRIVHDDPVRPMLVGVDFADPGARSRAVVSVYDARTVEVLTNGVPFEGTLRAFAERAPPLVDPADLTIEAFQEFAPGRNRAERRAHARRDKRRRGVR